MKRNSGMPRSTIKLTRDPLPYANTNAGSFVRYSDQELAEYFASDMWEFSPRPGFLQGEENYDR